MSKSDHSRTSRRERARRGDDLVTQRRQPRPATRRTGTRAGAIAAAIREG